MTRDKFKEVARNIKKEIKEIRRFSKYLKKVFNFETIAMMQNDSRGKRLHKTSVIFLILFWGFVFRVKSFNNLEEKINRGVFKPLFPKNTTMPSIDAIVNALKKWDIGKLEQSFQRILNTLYKNKHLKDGTIDGYNVCAIDGTDIITSQKRKCKNCMYMSNADGYRYVHKAVVAMTVGREINYIIKDCSLNVLLEETIKDKKSYENKIITKSEGEFTGAMKMLDELPSWVEIIVADALYYNAPFIKKALANSKDVVVRLKDKTSINYQMINHLSTYSTHTDSFVYEEYNKKFSVKYWELDKSITDWNVFTNDEGRNTDIRIYKFIETLEKNLRDGEKFEFKEILIGTTSKTISPKTLWKCIHYRWYIENTCFHQMKTYSNITHCYTHDDIAIQAILKIMFMAFNIVRSFLFKNLRNFRDDFNKKKVTITGFIEELFTQLTGILLLLKTKIIDINTLDISMNIT